MAGNLLRVKDLGEVEVTVLSSVIWRGAGKEIVLVLRSPAFAGWRGLHKDELETLRHKKEKVGLPQRSRLHWKALRRSLPLQSV